MIPWLLHDPDRAAAFFFAAWKFFQLFSKKRADSGKNPVL